MDVDVITGDGSYGSDSDETKSQPRVNTDTMLSDSDNGTEEAKMLSEAKPTDVVTIATRKRKVGDLKENKYEKYIPFIMKVFFGWLSLTDLVTDLILLYNAARYGNRSDITTQERRTILPITITLFLSVVTPYIISYSSGIKLFLKRKTFDELTGFSQMALIFYLLPTGPLFFILVDLLDLILGILRIFLFVIFGWSLYEINKFELNLAELFGMDRMNWEVCVSCASFGFF